MKKGYKLQGSGSVAGGRVNPIMGKTGMLSTSTTRPSGGVVSPVAARTTRKPVSNLSSVVRGAMGVPRR